MRSTPALQIGFTVFLLAACAGNEVTAPEAIVGRKLALRTSQASESQHFNNEVILSGDGFGLVKFRQPDDGSRTVYLDTWVRGLAPNTAYQLQRAVDAVVDGNCTSSAWLTLGKGTTPQTIVTDAEGTGREDLYRNLSALPPGATFDIYFQVIDAVTSAVVLTSGCYQFTVR